jgi:DNA repair protein RecN (Recombination protein N)
VRLVLGPGMTALTGETGAGKTLLIGAIDLLLGGRADPAMVRTGCDEAVIEGRFLVGGEEVVLTRSCPPTAARAPTSTAGWPRPPCWGSRPGR